MTPTTPALEPPHLRGRRNPGLVGAAAYILMLAAAVAAFFLVRHIGEGLTAPPPPAAVSETAPVEDRADVIFHVLLTLAAVIGLGHLLGRVFRALGQPPVMGEIFAGILLGPSLLGALAPDAMNWLIPGPAADPHRHVLSALQAIAQIGIVLYLFLVGLDLNGGKFRSDARSTVAITHSAIAFQFILGLGLALWLYPILSDRSVPFTNFALFLGVALSVTGFTVLARFLNETGLDRTELGTRTLGCAAVDDVTAWCLVAVVTGITVARLDGAAMVLAGAAAFVAVIFILVRPLAIWACRRLDRLNALPPAALPVLLVAVLLAALTTQAIGIHALFGAFLLGAVIPHDSRLAAEFTRKFKDIIVILLLPAFFALTGMRVDIWLIGGWQNWLICAAILAVAVAGKFGGTFVAARFAGLDSRTSAALGAMMNTRGLMGLIVLDVGLGLGVISPTLFAMMVLMALVTTLATAPALRRLMPEWNSPTATKTGS